jgi:hypothetical protein
LLASSSESAALLSSSSLSTCSTQTRKRF